MSDRKVVVTIGASSGIGQASARLLAQNGFLVFGGARDASQASAIPGVFFGNVDEVGSVAFRRSKPILAAINGPYRMRQPAGGQATLLSRLRRFMPASAVDRSLRKTFGFGK